MDTMKKNIQSFNFKEKEKTKKAYMKTESHERQKANHLIVEIFSSLGIKMLSANIFQGHDC